MIDTRIDTIDTRPLSFDRSPSARLGAWLASLESAARRQQLSHVLQFYGWKAALEHMTPRELDTYRGYLLHLIGLQGFGG